MPSKTPTAARAPGDKNALLIIDRSQIPIIACINKATIDLEVDFDGLIAALQKFLDDFFAPVWGTPAKLTRADKPLKGAWNMVFIDDPDKALDFLDHPHPGRFSGRHRLGTNGLPLAMVFVAQTLERSEKISLVACHELAEMLVDPALNLWALGPEETLYAYEVCDVVEEEEFLVNGLAMSDFVYPAYFENFRAPKSTKFDYLGKIERPFQILSRGYSQIRKRGKVETKFGSEEKKDHFKTEDRRLHRSEDRIG